MTRHERKFRSNDWVTLCVAVLACISLMLMVRLWLAGGQNRHRTSDEWALNSLVLEGHELHPSLRTHQLDSIRHLPPGVVPPENPQLSADDQFVEAISRSGSQGRLGREGIRSALYARYIGKSELGIYGLEAESAADADQRENALREIWANNGRLDRARVHREGLVLVVVWTDGVSPECWKSVNASVAKRLNAPGTM